MNPFKLHKVVLLSLSLPFVVSCNSTKNLAAEEFLITKTFVEKIYPSKKEKEKKGISEAIYLGGLEEDKAENYISQKPNTKMLGLFRFHLAMYNLANKKKKKNNEIIDVEKEEKRKSIGEPPVILDSNQTKKTVKQISMFLYNKGYFNSTVTDSVVYKKSKLRKKRGGKAKVYYKVKMGHRYLISNMYFDVNDPNMLNQIYSDSIYSHIIQGDYYDISLLDKERNRITRSFKNIGYYEFSKDYILFEADSTIKKGEIALTLRIKNQEKKINSDSTLVLSHKKYKINKIYIHTHYNTKKYLNDILDTIEFKDYQFVLTDSSLKKQNKNDFIKYHTITRKIFLREGDYFKITDLENTYNHLSGLQLFKFINIYFEKENENSLNCIIQLSTVPKQYFSIEAEGTHSQGNLGVGLNLAYINKNTFKGAENLQLRFKGALEAQKTFKVETEEKVPFLDLFNTLEIGPEIKYHIPKFLFPIKADIIPKRYNPTTTLSSAYNFQHRIDYTRSILNFTFGYEWKESIFKTHVFEPISISSTKIEDDSPILESINLISNDFIKFSFINHLTTATRYSFVFNNQVLGKNRNFSFFRGNIEFAGNTLRGINNLQNNNSETDTSYTIGGIQYAQYIRSDFDFRYYNIINRHSTLVFRLAAGIGVPYGNSQVLPFEKSFFVGGANGIRAWQTRNLGPGAYSGSKNYDQIGDIKVEVNLESRFKIISVFEGAAFIDAGNIWLTKEDANRPGAKFNASSFLSEFAIGAGLGLRFNFNFFIIRIDAAQPLKDPSLAKNERWKIKYAKIKDLNYNFGIGYPF